MTPCENLQFEKLFAGIGDVNIIVLEVCLSDHDFTSIVDKVSNKLCKNQNTII